MGEIKLCPIFQIVQNVIQTYTYEDGNLFVCPECAHEWTVELETEDNE